MIIAPLIKILITLLCLGLSGCINRDPYTIGPNKYRQHLSNNQLNNLSYWQAQGKIRFYSKHLHPKVFTGSFIWEKFSNLSLIKISTQFNLHSLGCKIYPNNTIQDLSNNKINIELLTTRMAESLDLPPAIVTKILVMNNFNYWLLGSPVPGLVYVATDEGFIQDDWLVRYQNFKDIMVDSKYISIPHKITLKYTGSKLINKRLELKFIVQKFVT